MDGGEGGLERKTQVTLGWGSTKGTLKQLLCMDNAINS